ncbi:MAG: HNH endonuclease [Elusimicrobiota bacterium]
MTSDVLVLNRNFYAIQIIDWQRAITLVYTDHAQIVDGEYRTYNFQDWQELSNAIKQHPAGFVHTPNFRIAVPEVIALRFYDKLPFQEVKFTRRNIYEHYGYKCCYCGKKFISEKLNLEHIIPLSRGGKTNWDNVVTACICCNLKKGNRFPNEAGMALLIKPTKPKWRGKYSLVIPSILKTKTSWQRFIDNIYWNSEIEE